MHFQLLFSVVEMHRQCRFDMQNELNFSIVREQTYYFNDQNNVEKGV